MLVASALTTCTMDGAWDMIRSQHAARSDDSGGGQTDPPTDGGGSGGGGTAPGDTVPGDGDTLPGDDGGSGDDGSGGDGDMGGGTPPAEPSAYRQRVEIAGVGQQLTDFPVLVLLPADWPGYDVATDEQVRFLDSPGGSVLAHEREGTWNAGQTTAYWVRIPLLDASSTDVWLYFGNHGIAESAEPSAAVWSNEYLAVWHLSEELPPYRDSSGNGFHGQVGGDPALVKPNRVELAYGYGQRFAAPATGIRIQSAAVSSPFVDPLALSYSMVINRETDINGCVLHTVPVRSPASLGVLTLTAGATMEFQVGYNNDPLSKVVPAPGTDTHAFYGVTWNGSNLADDVSLYVNSVLNTPTQTIDGKVNRTGSDAAATIVIGNSVEGTVGFSGAIKSVRIASVARSSAWMEAEYRTMMEPTNFVTFGEPEPLE